MKIIVYTLVSVFLVSSVSLVGIFTLLVSRALLQRILFLLVSFAVGGLFGDAFIHLLPETFRQLGTGLESSLYIILGIIMFFVLENFLRWRHCHAPVSETHVHPVVTMNFVGDAAHNVIDGMVIAASYMIDVKLGIATTLAVIFHEIPHEAGNCAIFIHGGLSAKDAILLNVATSFTSFLGALISIWLGTSFHGFAMALIPVTAGGFIYIAGSDLIPELQNRDNIKIIPSILQLISILLGISVMALLLLLD